MECVLPSFQRKPRGSSEQEGKERPGRQWNNTGFISCSSLPVFFSTSLQTHVACPDVLHAFHASQR